MCKKTAEIQEKEPNPSDFKPPTDPQLKGAIFTPFTFFTLKNTPMLYFICLLLVFRYSQLGLKYGLTKLHEEENINTKKYNKSLTIKHLKKKKKKNNTQTLKFVHNYPASAS